MLGLCTPPLCSLQRLFVMVIDDGCDINDSESGGDRVDSSGGGSNQGGGSNGDDKISNGGDRRGPDGGGNR